MANREALRELQSRLATRLQAARSGPVSASWLAVKAGQANYLFPLEQAGEIFPLSGVQHVPYCRAWFMGVTNLRGGLFGVVDLAGFVAKGAMRERTEPMLAQASVVTFGAALELNCALMVDTLAGLRKREALCEDAPPPPGSPAYFSSRFIDLEGVQWQEINLKALSQYPEFLSISA
jgi:twitching motility protein PilI